MPQYVFQDERDGTIHEVFQGMNDEHRAFSSDGYELKRVFLPTLGAVDTKWDANSKTDFANKTGSKKGTIGEILDKSKELSQVREEKYGKDEVKQKYYDDYAATRDGKRHMNEKKEKLKEIVKDVTIKWSKKNS